MIGIEELVQALLLVPQCEILQAVGAERLLGVLGQPRVKLLRQPFRDVDVPAVGECLCIARGIKTEHLAHMRPRSTRRYSEKPRDRLSFACMVG